MNWWGKIIGGVFGLLLTGNLIGVILGIVIGHYFDRGMGKITMGSLGVGSTSKIQETFFTSTFSIMGFVAKSDGRVTKDEISLAQQVMNQMRLSPAQRKVAIRLFEQGKQPGFRYQEVMGRFRKECFGRRNLIQMFLEIVTATALSDGRLNETEKRVLLNIAASLNYSVHDFEMLVNRLSAQANFSGHGRQGYESHVSRESQLESAYKTLSLTSSASDAEIKRAYRKLMSQHHPDKLISKGLPKEMMELANRKAQEIKQAYELIKEHRAI